MDETFWNKSIFFPGRDSSKLDSLLSNVYKKREVDFIAFCLQMNSIESEICSATEFDRLFEEFRNSDVQARQLVVRDPHFFAWFRQTVRLRGNKEKLQHKLDEFERVLQLINNAGKGKSTLLVKDQLVVLERFGLDPLIADLALPEYKSPEMERREEFNRNVVYPESFFYDTLEIALARIRNAWPEAYGYFPQFVKIAVDMVDGEFTSYSSSDHTGTIFVSTDNSPLVAMEEFLMHEYGHQILYHLMELDPLVSGENESVYELPWSGNKRDFYGYFHAFFIYVFMASYLERVRFRSAREQRRIVVRRKHVLSGLEEAKAVLGSEGGFTDHGFELFNNLVLEIEDLKSRLDR